MTTLRINGKAYDADPNKISFDDAELIEEITGDTFSEFGATLSRGSMRAVRVLAFVLLHQSDPDFTMEEMGKMPISSLEWVEDEKAKKVTHKGRVTKAVDPTEKASEPPATRS